MRDLRPTIIMLGCLFCFIVGIVTGVYTYKKTERPTHNITAIVEIADRAYYTGYVQGLQYCGCVTDTAWLQSLREKALGGNK